MKVEYTKIIGGLDLVSPALSLDSGKATVAVNYEPGDQGGLRRIDGYERFDGRPAPSAAVYYHCAVTFSGVVAVGNTITGATSGATGIVIEVGADYLTFTKLTGTFTADEELEVGAAVVAELDGAPAASGHDTGLENATALDLAAALYRADIAKPPGSGPVRGGGTLGGVLYVFRNNAGATALDLWKSTAAGWAQVPFFHEISFVTGVGAISDGQTITQLISLATALVRRVALQSGAWTAGDAAGRLIISTITGTFDATNALQVGGVTKATASSLATAITLAPGGSVETTLYNFTGSADTRRLYGCDGKNRGFELDGTVLAPISTGMTTDIPDHVGAHKNHLFFTFRGSLQNSGIGTPFAWTPLTGANEIGMGDVIQALVPLSGEAFGVIGERSSHQLLGTSILNFQLDTISPDVGGKAVQVLGSAAVMVGEHGVVRIQAAEAYGNFEQGSISRAVQPLISSLTIIASSVYRSRNQYRGYAANGRGFIATASAEKRGLDWVPVYYFTKIRYPININCVITGEDDTIYLCDDEGMVYQADKGPSFDGEEIEAFFRLVFNHSKGPTTIKSYQRAVLEMTAEAYAAIRIHPEFSYGDPRHATHLLQEATTQGMGGQWDVDNWNEVFWDSRLVANPAISIRGNGTNMAMVAYSESKLDQGHKIDGIVIHYLPRRLQR